MVRVGNGKYRVVRRLGGGAFGEVYLVALDPPTAPGESPRRISVPPSRSPSASARGGPAGATTVTATAATPPAPVPPIETVEYFAAKFEPVKSQYKPHLHHEARLYNLMAYNTVTVGIPRVKWFGTEGDFNILIMELVGPSLEELFDFCKRKFTVKTGLMLAQQMIARLEFVHTVGYLHRDLKPENFTMGIGKRAHHVYLLDFGLAHKYKDMRSGEHVPYVDGQPLIGTARYVSLRTHEGSLQSRRDDLESLAYVLMYLVRGNLPWQGVKCATKAEKYDRIRQMKQEMPPAALGTRLPNCFAEYMSYARGLTFAETPNYELCRDMFAKEMAAQDMQCDYYYSWLDQADQMDIGTSSATSVESSLNESSRRGISHFSEYSQSLNGSIAGGSTAGTVAVGVPGSPAGGMIIGGAQLRRHRRKPGHAGPVYGDDDELFV